MDFGPGGFKAFEFVPEYEGNRDLPALERISCEILRPTTAQRLAMESEAAGSLERWRDQHFAQWLGEGAEDPELREAIAAWDRDVIHVVKVVCVFTRNWRQARYDGRVLATPAEVCLYAPLPVGKVSLLREAYNAIIAASSLSGDQLKNFASQCAGASSGTTLVPMDNVTASAP